MPNFLLIGAPKAGTSALYAYLSQHPQVYMSPVKEPHFFMLENEKVNFQGPGDQDRFRRSVHQLGDYKKLFAGVTDEIAIGEASTTYLGNEKASRRIKKYIPEAKLIAILRNPVDAAYASFLHLVRDGNESIADFAKALAAEPERTQNNWGLMWRYQQKGFYYKQLKPYFELFDRQQIKIFIYEEFERNPELVMKDMFAFVGVDPSFKADMATKYNVSGMPKSQTLNKLLAQSNPLKESIKLLVPPKMRSTIYSKVRIWNLSNFKKPKMSEETRRQLTDSYRDDILKLQSLIQQDLSAWLKP